VRNPPIITLGYYRRPFIAVARMALVRFSMPYEVQLPRDPGAAGRARKLLAECFGARLTGRELDTAKLLTSELVTNAVVHGQGTITMLADLDEGRLRVEVIDEGTGLVRMVRRGTSQLSGGWGLRLVDSESSQWGAHSGRTHVWFELARTAAQFGVGAAAEAMT
jgi:anti-sigma regulatory factor (Ser/Thr protein kinase)